MNTRVIQETSLPLYHLLLVTFLEQIIKNLFHKVQFICLGLL